MSYRIWIVTVGEPLPMDGGTPRLMRAGIIANMLAEAGHDVTWWTSNVDHLKKKRRFPSETEIGVSAGLRLILLDGALYSRNVSLARIRNHRDVAAAFARRSSREPRPDVILCSFPTIELSREVCRFGRAHSVPVVIDIRDLWPDVLVDLAPKGLRWLSELVLSGMRRDTKWIMSQATAVLGVTIGYRDWGIAHARRPATPLDRVFPLAYSEQAPAAEAVEAAAAFWRAHGVGMGPDEFNIVFFGSINHQFEFGPVIAAARMMKTRGVDARFVLCGDGESLAGLRGDAAGLDNVLFPGWIDAPKIWTLMRRSQIGLAPYIDSDNFRRNLPNKVIEYLSGGLPVLTNLDGAVKEVLVENECGFFYGHGSPEELTAAIEQAVTDRATVGRRAANARALFEKSFSANIVYGDLIRFLEHLAARQASSGQVGGQGQRDALAVR